MGIQYNKPQIDIYAIHPKPAIALCLLQFIKSYTSPCQCRPFNIDGVKR